MTDIRDIKHLLQQRIGDVCRKLLPRGRMDGGQWVANNPAYNESRKTPALKVRIKGGVAGAWIDWRSGDKGDVIGLIEHCLRTDTRGALVWARAFLGIERMTPEQHRQLQQSAARQAQQQARQDEQDRRQKIERAQALWHAGTEPQLLPELSHGPYYAAEGHAINYFQARACPLQKVPNIAPHTYRFSAETEWWRGAVWRHENGRRWKEKPGPLFPAIHAAMRARTGAITACHCTFLDPVHPAKAPVDPPKLMRGIAKGAVIELSMGPEGKPFWQASAPHPVIICEGIETGNSLAIPLPEARVWAAASLSNIGNAPVDLPCVSDVIFARDNNAGNRQAQDQFETALAALEESGKRVGVMASHVGDDFNNLASGEA